MIGVAAMLERAIIPGRRMRPGMMAAGCDRNQL